MISLHVVQPSQTFDTFCGDHYIVGYFGQVQYSFVMITSASYCWECFSVWGGSMNYGISLTLLLVN
jgi:hypothetical protein